MRHASLERIFPLPLASAAMRFLLIALLASALLPTPLSAAQLNQADEEEALHVTGRWQNSFDFPLAIFWPTVKNFKAVHMALIPMSVPLSGGNNLRGKILVWGDHRAHAPWFSHSPLRQ